MQPTARASILAQGLTAQGLSMSSVGDVLGWLVERFGPALSEVLLDLIDRKAKQGVLPNQDLLGGLDVREMMAALLRSYGPTILDHVATSLSARPDMLSKLAGNLLQQYAAQIIQFVLGWLQSPAGTTAVQAAVVAAHVGP